MQKALMVISILLSAVGLRSVASAIEVSNNQIMSDLQNSGLTLQEIQDLDRLSQIDPLQFQKAIDQDYRINGKLKIEIMASSNGVGAGPCISRSRD